MCMVYCLQISKDITFTLSRISSQINKLQILSFMEHRLFKKSCFYQNVVLAIKTQAIHKAFLVFCSLTDSLPNTIYEEFQINIIIYYFQHDIFFLFFKKKSTMVSFLFPDNQIFQSTSKIVSRDTLNKYFSKDGLIL